MSNKAEQKASTSREKHSFKEPSTKDILAKHAEMAHMSDLKWARAMVMTIRDMHPERKQMWLNGLGLEYLQRNDAAD